LIAADLVLAFGSSIAAAGFGVALWGLHMGFTQGFARGARRRHRDASGAARRSACSILVTGLALLVASVLAGVLGIVAGLRSRFSQGAALTAAAGVVAFALYSSEERSTAAVAAAA
jgi:hypothetical protein